MKLIRFYLMISANLLLMWDIIILEVCKQSKYLICLNIWIRSLSCAWIVWVNSTFLSLCLVFYAILISVQETAWACMFEGYNLASKLPSRWMLSFQVDMDQVEWTVSIIFKMLPDCFYMLCNFYDQLDCNTRLSF